MKLFRPILWTLFLSFVYVLSLSASSNDDSPQYYKFRVYLKDKGIDDSLTAHPEKFLSPRAIQRKEKEKVPIGKSDIPISRDYFTLAEKAGGKVVTWSKWFSTLVIEVKDSVSIENIRQLPFVDSVKYIWRGVRPSQGIGLRPRLDQPDCVNNPDSVTVYGLTEQQFRLHNATFMADAGFKGSGILVGVIDAGFTNFDVIPRFSSVRLSGYKNFVPYGDMFASSDHGTKVLSTMTADLPGLMMGSAPEATYWLLRSEDTSSEFPVEEDYWVRAIEFADSLGVDIVNTSLGYNSFDDKKLNYTHQNLDGKVSLMSRAADMACQKGILLLVSAGNEGNKPWQKITPPADAKQVLAVGAIGTDSLVASFSSHGFTADGRFKPDLVSVGKNTVTLGSNGLVGYTNGTSLSTPFLTGLIASLWSVNPDIHRQELIDIVKESAHRYNAPDTVYGYGIPDFHKAMLKVMDLLDTHTGKIVDEEWTIEPLGSGTFTVSLTDPVLSFPSYSFSVLDLNGEIVSSQHFDEGDSLTVVLPDDVRRHDKRVYFLLKTPFRQRLYKVRIRE